MLAEVIIMYGWKKSTGDELRDGVECGEYCRFMTGYV